MLVSERVVVCRAIWTSAPGREGCGAKGYCAEPAVQLMRLVGMSLLTM